MVFPVIGGDGKPTGYEIDNSLRFNNPDDPNLSTTFSSAGNRRTFTISAWVKRGNIADDHTLFGQGGTSSGNPRGVLFFANSLRFTNNTSGSSTDTDVETSAKTRDPSAWYHAVVAVDTTQGTAANRVKLYLNGEQQTDLATATYPDQNFEMGWNNNVLHTVGRYPANDAYHMDGYISEFYFIDGTQYAASNFGETDDNGVWIPKDASGDLTFGTNGFYLEFKQTGTGTNSSGMGADTSGNDNHLAVNNLAATDVTTDTPTNNFATMIPAPNLTISEGNLNFTHNRTSNWDGTTASMGVQNGKWYYEAKLTSTDASPRHNIGFAGNPETWTVVVDGKGGGSDPTSNMTNAYWFHSNTNSAGYLNKTNTYGSNVSQWGIASGDIVGVALDMDNQKIYFHKNGTYYGADGNSSDPTNGTNPAYSSITTGIHYRPFLMLRNDGSETNTISMNFGNPVYAISSGNTDGLYGNFEYAPPSGYYALCTKRLAEYG